MTKTIYKFPLDIKDIQTIEMPDGAEILTVQVQKGTLNMWALLDVEKPLTERVFEVFGTGHPVYCDMGINRKYIGTAQTMGDNLVWHIFERL